MNICGNKELLDYSNKVGSVLKANADTAFIGLKKYGAFDFDFKWVGGILATNNKIYGITNGCTKVLEIDPATNGHTLFGDLSEGIFKWTGGCLYKDSCIYGFPRSANTLLKINFLDRTAEEMPLNTCYTSIDHHYSGALYNDTIYLAPRSEKHILAINLITMKTRKIGIDIVGNFTYCGAITHPNGRIYFLPQTNSKVMVLDPKTEHISFIGDEISPFCFGVSILPNGCMYGFSGYSQGVLKIDPDIDATSIICPYTLTGEKVTGIYGTKMAMNGKLYGVPGDSAHVFEFNPATETVSIAADIDEGEFNEAKCAGAALAPDGSVWLIPAKGRYIYRLGFDKIKKFMPESILCSVYFSNY